MRPIDQTRPRAGRDATRDRLVASVGLLIDRLTDGDRDDAARDALFAEVHAWQRAHVDVVARIAKASGASARDAAAVPTDVFRFARVAAHPPEDDVRVFLTSGTTSGARGAHHLRDLSLYDRAARAAARHALFPDVGRMRLVLLAPNEREAPDSSLSYMLSRFVDWFGAAESRYCWREGAPDVALLRDTLALAESEQMPVALLGTSLAFAHAEQALGERRFRLSRGSRVMHTGGFKGRASEVDPALLGARLAARYGIDERWIVQEYGMTELSSQMYERSIALAAGGRADAGSGPRAFWVPGWVRATVVDPETLAPVADGEIGLLRIDDLANVDTACAIQTSDLARASDGGVALVGRAAGAVPRGCSLAVEAARDRS
jgi:hypothetical protein